jgi:hypothetical protein
VDNNWSGQRFVLDVLLSASHPSNRKVQVGCRRSKSCIALVGKSTPNSEYLIAFEVFDGHLETIAAEQAVFEKHNNVWIAKGRSGEHAVVPLAGSGWQGLKATVDCGISDRQGFHAGAGDAVAGDKSQCAGDVMNVEGSAAAHGDAALKGYVQDAGSGGRRYSPRPTWLLWGWHNTCESPSPLASRRVEKMFHVDDGRCLANSSESAMESA